MKLGTSGPVVCPTLALSPHQAPWIWQSPGALWYAMGLLCARQVLSQIGFGLFGGRGTEGAPQLAMLRAD